MIGFIVACKKKGVTAGTIADYLSAQWHFYHYNDIVDTNWVRVRGYMGKHAQTVRDSAYGLEQIRKLMQISDLQYKVIATLFVRSSMRRAALTGLKVGDLFTLSHYPQIYGIYVYSGKPEEYSHVLYARTQDVYRCLFGGQKARWRRDNKRLASYTRCI